GTSLFVGSEPTRLALADDGQTMYVGLNGAAAVRKLDVSAQTAGIQFTLGTSNYDGAYLPDDIAVMPGSPGTVAVSKLNGGTTIYDAGVARTQSSTTGGSIEFGSPTRLYAGSNPVQKQSVDANGITNLAYFNTGSFGRTQYAGGLLYLSGGGVIDPETGVIKGRFTGLDYENVMAIDTAKNRAFFLTNNFSSGWNLRAFELDTFRLMGVVRVQGISSGPGLAPSSLVRWGKNGLAFRAYDRIFLIQTTLVDSTETVPAATPTPSPTPASSPVYIPTVVNKVNLPANDLVIDVGTQTLYASVPSSGGGAVGNSITSVDPKTGAIGASTFVGSEPNKLAISDDGQVLYVNLDGAKAVRRFDIATKTPGTQFAVGVDRPADMEVVPGSPQSLAVSRGTGGFSSSNSGVAVYDNGVQRPNTSNGGAYAIGPIEFGATPTRLYGYDSYSSGFELVKFSLDASGVNLVSLTRNLLSGYDHGLKFAGGRLYSSGGRVVDPEAMTLLGRFHSGGAAFVVDQTLGRAFFLSTNNGSNSGLVLSAYDINTFLPLGSVTLTGVFNTPVGLVRWGKNGLAFTTLPNSFNSTAEASQIYLVQSALVSDAEPIASVIQFSAATYNAFEGTGSTNGLITVLRTGSVTGAATVNYTTGGGTATPGSDYTATSGTLSFAEGETMKTFTVPITDDLVYEGAVRETIELTLSAPTGATLGSQKTAAINIQDNESRPYIVVNTLSVPEGQSGTTNAQFVVRLSNPSVETISVSYATADGTAQAESDYVAASGTLVFQPGEMEKSIPLQIKGDTVDEGNETFVINFSNPVNLNLYNTNGSVIIVADERPLIQFGAPEFTANEGDGRITVVVTRFGPTTDTATVNYSTLDDSRSIRCDDNISNNRVAFARCDYMTTFDTLVFAPGESEKTFTVPLVDDGHDEPREFIQVRLTTPVGATLGTPSTATLNFEDNDEPNQPNPIDTHGFFVRQHYLDFLSREPEADGLAAWTGVLNGCPDAFDGDAASPSAQCDRKLVSSSFFRSIEFELKGYFVYRFYRAAYNRRPSYTEFVGDMRRVTGQTAEDVYARRRAFGDAWVLRQEFVNRYGALTNAAYVDALLVRYGLTAINTTDPAAPDGDALVRLTRDDLVAALDAQHMTKAQVLRAIVQSREVDAAEYNGAFVAMQYYGYLRRAPEQSGYDAWLQVITRGDGYRVMVNGFMNSAEYRLRFGR
ncbi:MAG TPA: Calx-beta domain-containing protein, partial [Pyrinomonadaceae bacterium]|nr:Calx-beta domain-containing protein [Pyrinomonadaceae bacterium]